MTKYTLTTLRLRAKIFTSGPRVKLTLGFNDSFVNMDINKDALTEIIKFLQDDQTSEHVIMDREIHLELNNESP